LINFHFLSGTTTPSILFGSPKSCFGIHIEDFHSQSLNFMHFGGTKVWFVANQDNYETIAKYLRQVLFFIIKSKITKIFINQIIEHTRR
jgi:hypothetical protein